MSTTMETPEAFGRRARAWILDNLPAADRNVGLEADDDAEADSIAQARTLQRAIYEAGFAGIRYPVEFGGLGLTRAHQLEWADAARGHQLPTAFNVTHGIIGPTILEFGNDQQRKRYLPSMLNGDELWVQLLSEPNCGSDLAAVLTRATLDGDSFVVNGAKTWSTGAHHAEFGLALVRTNVDVPKHAGLSMLIVPMQSAGLTIRPIRLSTGASHFCEEFFDDVVVDGANLLGDAEAGWRVATGLLFHERAMVGGASYNDHLTASLGSSDEPAGDEFVELARRVGNLANPSTRQLIGESVVLRSLVRPTIARVNAMLQAGTVPPAAAGLLKLLSSTSNLRLSEIAIEIGGAELLQHLDEDESSFANRWLGSRTLTIAGGASEIQRNQISERVLGLPREPTPDKDVPFREVLAKRRSSTSTI